jgi:cytidylate kinase
MAASHLISAETADKLVHTGDLNRADYLKRFYGIEHEGPEHYDVVVDTDTLTVDDALAQIVAAAEAL